MTSSYAVLIMTPALDFERYALRHHSRFPEDRVVKVKTTSQFDQLNRDKAIQRREGTIFLMGQSFGAVPAHEAQEAIGENGTVLGCASSVTDQLYFDKHGIEMVWIENYNQGSVAVVDWITENLYGVEPARNELVRILETIGDERSGLYERQFLGQAEPETVGQIRERIDFIEQMKGNGNESIKGFKRFLRDRASNRFSGPGTGNPNRR